MTENNNLKEKLDAEVKRRMDLAEKTQVRYHSCVAPKHLCYHQTDLASAIDSNASLL